MATQQDKHQSQIIEYMRRPDFYPHPVRSVTLRETHISMVFLTGDYVYKIKKPVDMGFLDFTSLVKRQHYCRRELKLNRRLSRNVYLAVVPITFRQNRYYLDGSGRPVEYAIKCANCRTVRQWLIFCAMTNWMATALSCWRAF
ncbi:MAG: hypothetical protein P8X90_16010 [Desulfobacterales bacterium]